jgi:hypothetical protein
VPATRQWQENVPVERCRAGEENIGGATRSARREYQASADSGLKFMALPAHLAKYSGVLDIFVEALVAELLRDAEIKTPEVHEASGANLLSPTLTGFPTQGAPDVAQSTSKTRRKQTDHTETAP